MVGLYNSEPYKGNWKLTLGFNLPSLTIGRTLQRELKDSYVFEQPREDTYRTLQRELKVVENHINVEF